MINIFAALLQLILLLIEASVRGMHVNHLCKKIHVAVIKGDIKSMLKYSAAMDKELDTINKISMAADLYR